MRARATCLYLATRLGDLAADLVVVGGIVPSLLIDAGDLPESAEPHVGTMDVDLGMRLAIVEDGRYRTLAEALRQSGFEPDVNAAGRLTRQRWRLGDEPGVSVDFLVEPPRPERRGGDLLDLQGDFAAIITPGLGHAFRDREVRVTTQAGRCEWHVSSPGDPTTESRPTPPAS